MRGTEDFSEAQLAMYQAIPEGGYMPDKQRQALYDIEGEEITQFACHRCHDIGRPNEDDSIGQCFSCHLRHEFSIVQVRKPETCSRCHIGPDHPQWEIYQNSPHGVKYLTLGQNWNWEEEAGMLGVDDFPAPTCALCHISGFGASGTTHDIGDRLTWFLSAPQSTRRPNWEENKAKMQNVCFECHSDNFIEEFYTKADEAVGRVNEWVAESDVILNQINDAGYTTPESFDQPVDFIHFETWHHWGRTAKFGTWMQGPDYVQWHGAYEILRNLAELNDIASNIPGTEPISPESAVPGMIEDTGSGE
jgi:hypothetical protein